jgi:serine/threonine protein phosphatase 1
VPLPTHINYPVVAVGDLHGQTNSLHRLVARLRTLPEWPCCSLVFLGDLVDRGPDSRGTVGLVMELLAERPGSTCVSGNHDYALVRAAGLCGGPPDDRWSFHYGSTFDHAATFRSYLGRVPEYESLDAWRRDLGELREAVPAEQRSFLASLPWVAEAEGHIFLHNGLSPELEQPADDQLEALRCRRWPGELRPRAGTKTARSWQPYYPVWLGADRRLSADPLPAPGRVQVSGHVRVDAPDANAVRVRIDTTGGVREPLTACLLRGPDAPPEFVFSTEPG